MLSNSRRIILLCSITIASKLQFVFCNNITILGPHCTDTAGDKTENLNCGSSLEPNIDGGSITLGKLCPGGDRLQLRILRDDINIQASDLKVEAYVSKVSECDDPQDVIALMSPFMDQMLSPLGDVMIGSNLTSDVSNLEFPSDYAEQKRCGNIRIIFMIKEIVGSSERIHGTKSIQINITCPSNDNLDDTSIHAIYESEEIPDVEVGDINPFGPGSHVIMNYGNCYSPKTMACMYCGFEDGIVGVDDDSWNLWQTIEGRKAWAEGWQTQSDIFERLYRAGLCEPMHKQPLLDDIPETLRANGNVSLKLNRTFVPLPWAYDTLKDTEYIGKTVRCGMMVSVDLFGQCSDRDRSNNMAVFPVRLNVNEDRVEEVRQDVQLNWPDAETGVAVEDQNRACSVLSSYVDNGKSAMVFPTPQIDGFEGKVGMIYKGGQFQPLEFHDGRLWSSLVMSKLTAVNQDQCSSQCDVKYQETKDSPNMLKSMLDRFGKVINDTDDVIQRMRSSDFNDDLFKYKDVSQTVRELYQAFSMIPKTNRLMVKMMMKMVNGGKKDRRSHKGNKGGRYPPIHHPNDDHCSMEPVIEMIENMEDDELRSGLYFLPNHQDGYKCWTEGCDYEESVSICQQQGGSIASINGPHENQMIRWLLQRFGEFNPEQCSKDFSWFYIGLREEKSIDGTSHYHWEDGSTTNFTNWGGEEPNDYNGDSEECTFAIPETPGNFMSLDEGGPMWGDINCMATEFQWPTNPNSYVRMVPICEVPMSRCQNEGLVCENGGSCWDKADGSSECVCFGGYTGSHCEYPPDDTNQESSTTASTIAATTEGGFGGFGRKKREDSYGWGSIFKDKNKEISFKNSMKDRFSGKGDKSRHKNSFGSRRNGDENDKMGMQKGRNSFEFGGSKKDEGEFSLERFRKGNQRERLMGTEDRQQSRGQSGSNWGQHGKQQGYGFGNKNSRGSQRGGSKMPNGKGNSNRFNKMNEGGKHGHNKNSGWLDDQHMYDDNASSDYDDWPMIADDWLESSYDDDGNFSGVGYGNDDWNNFDDNEDWNDFTSHPIYDNYGNEDRNDGWYSGNGHEGGFGNDMLFPGSNFEDFENSWDTSHQTTFNNNLDHRNKEYNDFKKKGNRGNRNGQLKGKSKKNKGRLNRYNGKRKHKNGNNLKKGALAGAMFFKDMLRCDEMPTCGKGGIMQELKSCICESFWSKNADPTGSLCQAIPKSTREKAVGVISMFMKGNGPAMPRNRTTLRKLKRMADTWGNKFARLVSTPFDKDDTQMLLQMERDNLTDGISDLESNGVSRPDLAAPTLYRDLVIGALASNSKMIDSLTELVQMIQGLSHQNIKRCDRNGKPGDAPTKEEFCMAYRAKKLVDQYKCPFVMELKQHLNNNGLHDDERKMLIESIKSFGGMNDSGRKGSCGRSPERKSRKEIPIIWRKHMGNIVKASFCELDGQWYWEKVATCGGGEFN